MRLKPPERATLCLCRLLPLHGDTWHDNSYFRGSELIITSRIQSFLRTDNHSHVIMPLIAHQLYALSEERGIGVNLMDYQLQQSQLWEKHLQDDAYGVPTQHQLYCHECRFARVWVPHRQQMSNAMVITPWIRNVYTPCLAFARPLSILAPREAKARAQF